MRFTITLFSVALLSALVSAAPVGSSDLAERSFGNGKTSPEWKRSCPNGSQGCGERREVPVARGCTGGGACHDY